MSEKTLNKLRHVVVADPESHVRLDMGRTLLRLAETVDRFSDGENALHFIKEHQPEIAVIALGCWLDPDIAISDIKNLGRGYRGDLVITHRKLLPRHVGRLNGLNVKHVVNHPVDPLLLFRLAKERYGVVARRFDRVQFGCDVFWGYGDDRQVIGRTEDISRGGLLLVSERTLCKGSSFFVGISPEGCREVELRGEVVHVDPNTFSPAIGYGLLFVELRTTTAMFLDEVIEGLQHKGAVEAPVTFAPDIGT